MPNKNDGPNPTDALFLEFARSKLKQLQQRILEASNSLPEATFWAEPNSSSNSVAQLLLHLSGNIRQWILHGVDRQADVRERDAEFSASPAGAWTREEILRHFASTLDEALVVLQSLKPERLSERTRPQGFELSVLEAIFHVTEHCSYHAGQIFLLVKLNLDKDLKFYSYLSNSNKTNSGEIP